MKFFADCMLGKLARWLRILGYDARFERAMEDDEALAEAMAEERIFLTRDRVLCERKVKPEILLIESTDPKKQILQVLDACGLEVRRSQFFRRCLACNGETRVVDRKEVRDEVPPYVYATQARFSRCPGCGRIYWQATHYKNMMTELDQVLKTHSANQKDT
jgi:uncharacterized protein with PIN domain